MSGADYAACHDSITYQVVVDLPQLTRRSILAYTSQLRHNGELVEPPMGSTWPVITDEDRARVADCLTSGKLWRGDEGPYLRQLEERFAALHGARYGLAVTNGTHALEIALAALGIGFGHEVLVPAFTFVATATAVLARNALPIPVDVEPDTFCLDAKRLAERITPRTRAIVPVHLGGHACDMDAILEVARERNLHVIEDCAQAHGAHYRDQPVGSLGDIGAFSFQAGKAMTAGEGGMLVTNDEALWSRAYSLSNCGRSFRGSNNTYVCLASNYRMPELLAALLVGQIDRLAEQTQRRERSAAWLSLQLRSLDGIEAQVRRPFARVQTYSLYLLRYHAKAFGGLLRADFISALAAQGFAVNPGHPLFYETPFFATLYEDNPQFLHLPSRPDYQAFECPVARRVSDEVVWCRHALLLDDPSELNRFVTAIRTIQANQGGRSPETVEEITND